MPRRPTTARLAIAVGLAVGLSVGIAPLGAAGSTAVVGGSGSGPIASLGAHVVPTIDDLIPVVAFTAAESSEPSEIPAPPAVEPTVPEPAPAPVEDAPVAEVQLAEAQVTEAPVTEAPVAEAQPVSTSGTIHVDVVAVEGATRTISLRSTDGTTVAGPVTVDGARISFADLDDGTYDVFAEQHWDGGGTFVTRTPVEVAGGESFVRCDDDTLDCSAS